MAEYMLRDAMGADSDWTVASAGIVAGYGMCASEAGVTVLREEGIDLSPHRSQLLDRQLVDAAAVIVVMTAAHLGQIRMLYPDAMERVFLLRSFGGPSADVPDPIGSSVATYQRTMDLIDQAFPELISFLKTLDIN